MLWELSYDNFIMDMATIPPVEKPESDNGKLIEPENEFDELRKAIDVS